MVGAILGDMIGAPYEFDRGDKTKDFPLFCKGSGFTDDSVMTVAVAEALTDSLGKSDKEIKKALVGSMQKWGRKYPDAGYGARFIHWLRAEDPQPYGSFGNGSAMRVSAAGWLYGSLEETRHAARLTAEVTHDHPEGIKGAEATASAIYLARNGKNKEEIKNYIIREFGYDLSRTCDEIRPTYHHVESCQETVPEAITAFLEGQSFEDVIRTAVSLGGDCDTLTCIAGSMAEAFYGVPKELEHECLKRLPKDMGKVLKRFDSLKGRESREADDPGLKGNSMKEENNGNRICIEMGDITELKVDAIVNAANRSLRGGGGVDGAIHRAAGPGLDEECRKLGGCETGEAKITGGWRLPARYVIHTVGPIYQAKDPRCEKLLYACYRNSLEVAKEHGLHTVAFPAISTGVYGYPKQAAAEIALRAVSDWLSENPDYGMAVTMVCRDRETRTCYQDVIDAAASGKKNV